ncbi:MAG: LuxR C-terminal-related transcriptional regulator [Treponema sp.]|nr:LuxR C-terminal-related transcriptional regulator [Treponema sp.]
MSNSIQQVGNITGADAIYDEFHLKRSRLNQLLHEAMKYPVIVVCAGAGYGKTMAIHDFVQEYQADTVWVQLSERDNVGGRFWENFSHSMTLINNASFAMSIKELGFPDTQEKIKQYVSLLHDHADKKRRVIVFDDCHYIENSAVINFVQEGIRSLPLGTTLFIISRSTPNINIAGLISSNKIFNVSEDELRFTENELSQYLRAQNILLEPDSLRKIMQDTEGWAFALNYIARSYRKAPGYDGYLRNAMKSNIFRFMEMEVWNTISNQLQIFLVRLSLIDHLSIDLIVELTKTVPPSSKAASDEKNPVEDNIITEMEKQNAYVRRDSYINAYLIHPLFLEFLATKQNLLTKDQKNETYSIAGEWCKKNDFKIDALSYYEKIDDYNSIVDMFKGAPSQIPYDIACYTAKIMERAPSKAFDTVLYLASTHMRTIMCQGLWDEAIKLAELYEARFVNLPVSEFKRHALSSIYYCWAISCGSLCLTNDIYNFDLIYEKQAKCFLSPFDPGNLITRSQGPWASIVGSSRKGSVQDYIDAGKRSTTHLSSWYINFDSGDDALLDGEYKFYQGELSEAESNLKKTVNRARERKRPYFLHRALFYMLRIAVAQGNYAQTQHLLKEMKTMLDDPNYYARFTDYDIALCWYYCALGMPEKAPDWLKENFSLYAYATFSENYANQMKGRYCFVTRNYSHLLSYIHDMKQRESYLFGRVEMLAFEACVHYKMKDKEKAYNALQEAYLTATPNNILTPFIELGKDMRTLTFFALKESNGKIPKSWLEDINRKSASYAKRLAHVITEYKQAFGLTHIPVISPRESEILSDLSQGLSRAEIAASRNLSINTVKMLINNVYMKLGAENLAEAIRIAAERKIV